ncbi:MAG: hypothetical protein AAGI45_00995 [Cyanobacteria bacterium P01_H01_bin.26]
MSFHHTPPHKNSSFDPADFPGSLSKPIPNAAPQVFATEALDTQEPKSKIEYDDEARFELLSTYIDNEVTPAERRLVAQWLTEDLHTQHTYRQLLMLRQAIRTAPIPAQSPPQIPASPQLSWGTMPPLRLHRTIVWVGAISLVISLGQLATPAGRQQLQEAWQIIKALPQTAVPKIAFDRTQRPHPPSHFNQQTGE